MTDRPAAPADARILLGVAATLALVAGYVDAICFDGVFDVFPANQSGNAVLLGISIGKGRGGDSWRPAVAIVGFALGVGLAIVLGSRIPHRHRPELLLALEVVMLAPLVVVLLDADHPTATLTGAGAGLLLLLTTAAMGIQTEVIRRVAGVAVATTYQSGAIVRMSELAVRRLVPGAPDDGTLPGVAVLAAVLAAYVAGAAFGAALDGGRGALLVPVAVLVLLGASAPRWRLRLEQPPAGTQ